MSKNTSLKTVRKWILFFVGFVVIALSFQLSKLIIDSNPSPRKKAENSVKEVYTLKAKNGPLQVQIPSKGVLQAYKRIQITSRVQGVMQTINPLFKTGQSYKKGQQLVQIASSEFRSNVIAQRASLYNLITSVLPDLQLDFPKAYELWSAYLKSFDLKKPVPSLPKMDEKVRLFVSGRGIISSYYTLQNLEKTLTFYKIKAPFNGVLVSANVTEGSLIRPGQDLGEFIAPGDYELRVALPRSYVSNITEGAEVKVKSIDDERIYTGIVSRINAMVDSQTQSVKVFIRLRDENLKEGMFMNAEINAMKFNNVFAVDRGLLNESQELFVVQDNKLILKKVNPIHFTETLALIQGLADGEEIVAQPLIGAYEDMEVFPIPFEQKK